MNLKTYPPPINSEFSFRQMTFIARLNTIPYGKGACYGCYFDLAEDCRDPINKGLPRCCGRTFKRIDDLPKDYFKWQY